MDKGLERAWLANVRQWHTQKLLEALERPRVELVDLSGPCGVEGVDVSDNLVGQWLSELLVWQGASGHNAQGEYDCEFHLFAFFFLINSTKIEIFLGDFYFYSFIYIREFLCLCLIAKFYDL
jgi:hypothetical protein